jgi:hypothetical protein
MAPAGMPRQYGARDGGPIAIGTGPSSIHVMSVTLWMRIAKRHRGRIANESGVHAIGTASVRYVPFLASIRVEILASRHPPPLFRGRGSLHTPRPAHGVRGTAAQRAAGDRRACRERAKSGLPPIGGGRSLHLNRRRRSGGLLRGRRRLRGGAAAPDQQRRRGDQRRSADEAKARKYMGHWLLQG